MMRFNNQAPRMLTNVVLAFACLFVCAPVAVARDVALVTSKKNPVQVVKAADLVKMIKTTHKQLDHDDVTLIVTNPSSPEMRVVAEKLLSVTTDEFRKLIDAASKTKPTFLVVSNDDEVLKALQSNPSAIGLVNVYSINSNVEVLKIDGKLPLEPGYLLHSQ
jgi:ABC-type phosphate transport system substrate-binding protein